MADVGSVSRIFDRKGVVEVSKAQGGTNLDEDTLLEATLDADPEDVSDEGEVFKASPTPAWWRMRARQCSGGRVRLRIGRGAVRTAVHPGDRGTWTPPRSCSEADAIEEVDDVQAVYSNEDVPDEVLAELE